MEKMKIRERLEEIVRLSDTSGVYNYNISLNVWENYGKKRLYIAVYETRANSTHNKKYDFGFVDLLTGEYKPGKKDFREDYTLGGMNLYK